MQSNTDTKLSELIFFFSEQGKTIKKGFLLGQTKAGTKNIYGEEQMALDKWADNALTSTSKLS